MDFRKNLITQITKAMNNNTGGIAFSGKGRVIKLSLLTEEIQARSLSDTLLYFLMLGNISLNLVESRKAHHL